MKKEKLTLIEHLAELRKRLFLGAASLIVASAVSYFYVESIVKNILGLSEKYDFIYLSPAELFLSYIKLSVIIGAAISAPIILLQLWVFVKPGLKKQEKKYILVSLIGGSLLFFLGVIFCYRVVIPFTLEFFSKMNIDEIKAAISFDSYLSFITSMLLSFGIVFELPVIMLLLSYFGILKSAFLKKNGKYAILIIFVVAAIITPPDVVSQVLIAVPMVLLYQLGYFFTKLIERKRKKNLALRS